MLTVKHITLSGEEFIYPTPSVNFVPGRAKGQQPMSATGIGRLVEETDSVWIYEAGIPARELTGGTVFVMNEHGKTVSRYDLGASGVAHGVDPHGQRRFIRRPHRVTSA